MPRRGAKRVKTRTHKGSEPEGATVLEGGVQTALANDMVPRSIVARSGKVITQVSELIRDMRKLMGPHTTAKLQEKRGNKMKDYSAVASQLGVSHLLLLSQTNTNVVFRVARAPNGPTLHFHVTEYTLASQIRANQKRPHENANNYLTPPLVVLNDFGAATEQHVKLMKVSFQHMFPSINVKTVKLADCRRVVLFHLRKEDGQVEMRHFALTASPVGINRNLKKIINGKLPNLSNLTDVSEDETSHVQLAQNIAGKGNANSQKSALKLVELGPRMTLKLFKVEKGVCEGEVLYHGLITKTAEEAKHTKNRRENEASQKAERRAVQEANVSRKRAVEEEKKQNKKRRINKYTTESAEGVDGDDDEAAAMVQGNEGFEEVGSDDGNNDAGSYEQGDDENDSD
eukprot:GSChrysophyteH2.ASY1.ANO1.1045.1 assembled CDS